MTDPGRWDRLNRDPVADDPPDWPDDDPDAGWPVVNWDEIRALYGGDPRRYGLRPVRDLTVAEEFL